MEMTNLRSACVRLFHAVRVKDGMSLRNGIIMTAECNLCSVTINYALFENLEEFQRKAYSNVLPEIFDVCLEL